MSKSYRVGFFNKFARGAKVHKVCQRSVIVQSASNAEEAVETAKQRFAQLEGIRDWRIHAAIIEIAPISSDPDIGKGPEIWKPVGPEPVARRHRR